MAPGETRSHFSFFIGEIPARVNTTALILVGGERQCYFPGELEPQPPSPPAATLVLPLPPLPLAAYPADWTPLDFPVSYGGYLPQRSWPRIWTVFVVLVVAFIASQMTGLFVSIFLLLKQHHGPFDSIEQAQKELLETLTRPAGLLITGLSIQLVIFSSAMGAAILSPVPTVRRLRLNPSTLSVFGYLVAPIGALSIAFLFSSLVQLLHIPEQGTLKAISETFTKLTPLQLVAAIAVVGIMPGFAEEFLFRGYMQTRFSQALGRWGAIMLTAIFFGIMHMDVLQSPFAFGFGIYLGYVSEKAGSIRPTMLCHAFNNSVQVILGSLLHANSQEPSIGASLILAVICAAILTLCCLYFRYKVHPPAEAESGATSGSLAFA